MSIIVVGVVLMFIVVGIVMSVGKDSAPSAPAETSSADTWECSCGQTNPADDAECSVCGMQKEDMT
jgi:hypothetical protein